MAIGQLLGLLLLLALFAAACRPRGEEISVPLDGNPGVVPHARVLDGPELFSRVRCEGRTISCE